MLIYQVSYLIMKMAGNTAYTIFYVCYESVIMYFHFCQLRIITLRPSLFYVFVGSCHVTFTIA